MQRARIQYKNSILYAGLFFSGVLAAVSFDKPQYLFVFGIALLSLSYLVESLRGSYFKGGYLFGFGFFLTATWWLSVLEGYWYLPFLLSAYEAIFFAVPVYLSRRFFASKSDIRFYILFILISLFEFLRGYGRFGFPWMSGGFYLSETIFKKALYVYGIYAAGWIFYLMIAALASVLFSRKKITSFFIVFILLALLALPNAVNEPKFAEKITFQLLQDNILPSEKHHKDILQREKLISEHYSKLLEMASTDYDLIVFPESVHPGIYPWGVLSDSKVLNLSAGGSVVILGCESFENEKYYNSLVIFENKKPVYKYDKRFLVPFGEYLPYRDRLRWVPVVRDTTDFSFGKTQPVVVTSKAKLGLGICWESAIPGYGTEAALKGANLLVFSTNDNWFLHTNQSRAHWRHTKSQSDASGIPVLQCANAGITGFYFSGKERTLRVWQVDSLVGSVHLSRPDLRYLKAQKIIEKSFLFIFLAVVILASLNSRKF